MSAGSDLATRAGNAVADMEPPDEAIPMSSPFTCQPISHRARRIHFLTRPQLLIRI
jgi:hypothetical protein